MKTLIRVMMRFPALDPLTRITVGYAIAVFRRFCDDQPIITSYDRDLKIGLRLTKLLESYLYFCDIDWKDRGEVMLLKSLVKPEQIVFDVGGNIGQTALLMAKRVQSKGQVHVFEPARSNFERLQANVALNGFAQVMLNKNAVSNQKQSITLYLPRTYNTGAVSLYPDEDWQFDTETVDAIRLDDYARDHELARVDFIKIDVEGAEMDVLEGAEQILAAHRPIVLMEATRAILERAGRSFEGLFDFWARRQYRLYAIDDRGAVHPLTSSAAFSDDQNLYCLPSEKVQP